MKVQKYKTRALDEIMYQSEWYYDYIGDSFFMFPYDGVALTGGNDGPLRCYSDQYISVKFSKEECDEHKWIIMAMEEVSNNPHSIQLLYSQSEKILSIQSALPEENYTVELFHTNGNKAATFSGMLCSLAELPAGIYSVRIRAGETCVYSNKIRVE